MGDLPLVSILCLCYNQEKFIVESLESIKALTYNNFEMVICDDFSDDSSVETIEKWIRQNPDLQISFVKHTENLGITKTLNELLLISKGKYIQLLALDDLLMHNKLERQVTMLKNSSDKVSLVFSDAHLIDENSELYQNKFIARHLSYLSLKSQNFYEMLLVKNFIPAMSVLIKRQKLMDEGGFDESLSFEDHDMWLRLSKKDDFLFDDVISCSYRLHAHNTHKKREVLNHSMFFKIMIKHKDHQLAREKIFEHLEKLYLLNVLKNEHQIFFQHFPVKSFPEKLIKYNMKPVFYKLAMQIHKLLAYLKSPY
ncbi:glycosyltransferase [Epilithonimonas sp.]|uniref:glycosyltransferase n=1 Tax=Epilithonimonas sp. TaxID=2894511 RepID=UPI002FDED6B3